VETLQSVLGSYSPQQLNKILRKLTNDQREEAAQLVEAEGFCNVVSRHVPLDPKIIGQTRDCPLWWSCPCTFVTWQLCDLRPKVHLSLLKHSLPDAVGQLRGSGRSTRVAAHRRENYRKQEGQCRG
jgi:hypothetical protein